MNDESVSRSRKRGIGREKEQTHSRRIVPSSSPESLERRPFPIRTTPPEPCASSRRRSENCLLEPSVSIKATKKRRRTEKLSLRIKLVKLRRSLLRSDSFDLVRSKLHSLLVDIRGVRDRILVRRDVISTIFRSGGRYFESIGIVVRTGGDSMLRVTVSGGRDERTDRSVDGKRGDF